MPTIIQALTQAVINYTRRRLDNAWGTEPDGGLGTATLSCALDGLEEDGLLVTDPDGVAGLNFSSVTWALGVATFQTERGVVVGSPYAKPPTVVLLRG